MQTVYIHEAKTKFSRLADVAGSGEEIVIAKARKRTARLVPLEQVKFKCRFGGLKGRIRIADDFDAPPRRCDRSIRGSLMRLLLDTHVYLWSTRRIGISRQWPFAAHDFEQIRMTAVT